MKGVSSETPKLSQKKGYCPRSRRQRVWLLLGMVGLCLSVMVVLLRLEDSSKIQPNSTQRVSASLTPSARKGTRSPLPIPTIDATIQTVTPSLYKVSSTNVGLMQPAVDAQGKVWVGEMATNRLCRLNSHTGEVTTWQPPDARFGIMMTAIDPSGNVWFVEQNANYIGRFDPVQQTFHTFPLGRVHGHPMGPQTLLFDASGSLWFTAVAGSIGRLNPITGAVQTWSTTDVSPFSLTVTSDGQVWFGNFTKGIGHLDPHTGHVTLFHLANENAIVFSMAHDTKGHIYALC